MLVWLIFESSPQEFVVCLNTVKQGQEIYLASRNDESSQIWEFERLLIQYRSIADRSVIGMVVADGSWSQNQRWQSRDRDWILAHEVKEHSLIRSCDFGIRRTATGSNQDLYNAQGNVSAGQRNPRFNIGLSFSMRPQSLGIEIMLIEVRHF
jgi:hypothetical protein